MASLRQRGKKKQWYALFRDAAGKSRERPTKTTDRKQAQKMADQWEASARPSAGQSSVEAMRRVIANLHKELLGREMLRMSVAEFATVWVETKRGEVSASTAVVYARVTKSFCDFLGPRAAEEMFLVMREDVIRYRDHVGARLAARTANHHLRVLRMWFRQARVDGWMTENVVELVKPLKQRPDELREKRAFTAEEIRRLITTARALAIEDPQRWQDWPALIIRGYYTGQRLGDIALMTAGNEDVLLKEMSLKTRKTGRWIVLPMHEAYLNMVLAQDAGDDEKALLHPLAAASVKRNKGRVVTLSWQFAKLLVAAGLREPLKREKGSEKPETSRVGQGKGQRKAFYETSFHSLRHSMSTHLANAGITQAVVKDMVGHESTATNNLYTHLDMSLKVSAMAKLPNVVG